MAGSNPETRTVAGADHTTGLRPGRPRAHSTVPLAYLRKGETFAIRGRVRVGTTTAWRYVDQTAELLAVRAPKLRLAVRDAKRAGYAFVVAVAFDWYDATVERVT